MKKSINQIEAEQFVISTLVFISEQAERFNTSEEFIEQALVGFLDLIAQKRKEEQALVEVIDLIAQKRKEEQEEE